MDSVNATPGGFVYNCRRLDFGQGDVKHLFNVNRFVKQQLFGSLSSGRHDATSGAVLLTSTAAGWLGGVNMHLHNENERGVLNSGRETLCVCITLTVSANSTASAWRRVVMMPTTHQHCI